MCFFFLAVWKIILHLDRDIIALFWLKVSQKELVTLFITHFVRFNLSMPVAIDIYGVWGDCALCELRVSIWFVPCDQNTPLSVGGLLRDGRSWWPYRWGNVNSFWWGTFLASSSQYRNNVDSHCPACKIKINNYVLFLFFFLKQQQFFTFFYY